MPAARALAYIAASMILWLTQGLGLNLVSANLPTVQASLNATPIEGAWLVAAYMAPNVTLSLLLVKVRMQYGLRLFAEMSIALYAVVTVLHLFIDGLHSAIVVRAALGIAASPISSLGFLYMLEAFPPAKKMTVGLSMAMLGTQIGAPLARIISPSLINGGGWREFYMIEIALALMSFAAIYLLPLTPAPRAKVIERLDIVSFLLIAVGFGSLAVILSVGRLYWWFEAPWIGVTLAAAIAAFTAAVMIEINRDNPLIDIRWLLTRDMLHFSAVLLVLRLVLSEQTTGAVGFFQALGLTNDQLVTLFCIVLIAILLGTAVIAMTTRPERETYIHLVGLALIASGAWMDAQATNLTRPVNLYLSQALIAFAGTLFLPPALARGVMAAMRKGPNYILSFIIIFLTTQSIGGLLGSAVFGTFITYREKYHSNVIAQAITLGDPQVLQRLRQLTTAYGRVLTDKALLNAEGLALLGQQVTREANVLAYNDLFLLIVALSLFGFFALLIQLAWRVLKPVMEARLETRPA
ncbi:MFS transporter [Microvirga sp. 2MCAF38]|uniref:MFS transporter n=1 Tax=Microvirga sp. 2MCAF38 TaxID=3232989 RepID=UPI003F951C34